MAAQLSAAERGLISELCTRGTEWAAGAACRPEPVGILSGGYGNRAILLEAQQQRWVLRIRSSDAGFDFDSELNNHLQAAAADIAPTLRFSDRKRGLMIMDYIHSDHQPPTCDKRRQARGEPAEIAALLQAIHALPAEGPPLHTPSLLMQQRQQIDPTSRLAGTLASAAQALRAAARLIAKEMPRTSVLCHNDLLTANRIRRTDGALLALDWEYAAPGDPFFDLAVCASEMPASDTLTLLERYLGHPPCPRERAHFDAQSLLYHGIEACWFEIHSTAMVAAAQSHQRLVALLATPLAKDTT